MAIKITINYSPNFSINKRKKKHIKYLIFHYTGMNSEKVAINRLTNFQSGVSSHYFIKKNGKILILVPDLYIAWHAGRSSWKKIKSLNKNSIGIEISNPGHQFGYTKYSNKQIKSLIKLCKILVKKYNIKKNCILGHSDIAPDRKKDPGEKFPWKYVFKKKIGIWHNLNDKKIYLLRNKIVSVKEKNLFIQSLEKFGYPTKSFIFKNKERFNKLLIKSFQRRFRPELINGKIDQECLLIITKLISIKI